MYYELYLDSLFLTDFIMNFYMLYLVKRVRKCTVTHLRITLAAAYGAVIYCLLFILPFRVLHGYAAVKIVIGLLVSGTGMTAIAFGCRKFSQYVKMLSSLLGAAFFQGGICLFLRNRIPFFQDADKSILYTAVVGGLACVLGSFVAEKSRNRNTQFCRVTFPTENGNLTVDALLDTGNFLTEPISQNPVSVLDYDTALKLFDGQMPEYYRVVPFTSVGKQKGYLKCFEIPKIWVEYQDQTKMLTGILAACSEEYRQTNGVQMILNPQLMKIKEEKKYDI